MVQYFPNVQVPNQHIMSGDATAAETKVVEPSVEKGLKDKLVLITGASSGIGKATAVLAAKNGAKVFAVGRNEDALKALAEEINCGYIAADLTLGCEKIVAEAVKYLGGLSTLVNCAGVLKGGSIENASLEDFDFNFNGNVRQVFEMMNRTIPHLKAFGEGASIVNVSSVNGIQSYANVATCTFNFPYSFACLFSIMYANITAAACVRLLLTLNIHLSLICDI